MPIAPSGFDQDTPRPTIAGLGDAAAVDRVSCGAFGGYETEIPHQLAGVLKARQIADLGQHRHCRNEIYPAHRLLQTLDTLALLAHRPQKLFERNTLLAMLELLQHEPIHVGQPPRLLARIMSPEPTLKDAIAATDGLLLVTPEYNNSIPGVFKNAIDWLSRPPSDIPRVFSGKPVAIIGASPGGFGTILSQEAWLPVLRTLGTRPWFGGRLLVSRAATVFDEGGGIVNDSIKEQLRQFIHGFVSFVRSIPGRKA